MPPGGGGSVGCNIPEIDELGDWLGTVITHLALLNSAYGIYGRKPRNQTGRVPAT